MKEYIMFKELEKNGYRYEFVKLDTIEFFEDTSELLYDIEVEDSHSFVLESGLIVHNSIKQARNRRTQAILALKGKILNVEKTSINRMLESEEIKNIIMCLGVGYNKENLDLSKLRYHKIVLTPDADVDGGHICASLLTFFYKHMRKLIEEGHLYIAVPPLYKVRMGGKDTYCITDEDLNKVISGKSNYTIQRFKGLGEMSAEQLFDTTMNENDRTLVQINIEDFEDTDRLFEVLMGNAIEERKKYIIDNASEFELIN